jgi:hypothetical protein
MKKVLTRNIKELYFYKNGAKLIVDPNNPKTFPSGVRGDLTGVWGNLTEVRGDLSEVRGDLTGVWGNLTEVRGNIDDCKLTEEDRKKGVNIKDLITTKHEKT